MIFSLKTHIHSITICADSFNKRKGNPLFLACFSFFLKFLTSSFFLTYPDAITNCPSLKFRIRIAPAKYVHTGRVCPRVSIHHHRIVHPYTAFSVGGESKSFVTDFQVQVLLSEFHRTDSQPYNQMRSFTYLPNLTERIIHGKKIQSLKIFLKTHISKSNVVLLLDVLPYEIETSQGSETDFPNTKK